MGDVLTVPDPFVPRNTWEIHGESLPIAEHRLNDGTILWIPKKMNLYHSTKDDRWVLQWRGQTRMVHSERTCTMDSIRRMIWRWWMAVHLTGHTRRVNVNPALDTLCTGVAVTRSKIRDRPFSQISVVTSYRVPDVRTKAMHKQTCRFIGNEQHFKEEYQSRYNRLYEKLGQAIELRRHYERTVLQEGKPLQQSYGKPEDFEITDATKHHLSMLNLHDMIEYAFKQ